MSRKKLKSLAKSQIRRNVAILFVFYLVSAAIMGAFIGSPLNFKHPYINFSLTN